VKRLVAAAVFGLAAAAALGWGCATTQATGDKGARPAEQTPDGGWQSYRPSPSPSNPDPTRAGAADSSHQPGMSLTDMH
jgi:hypothetical protein